MRVRMLNGNQWAVPGFIGDVNADIRKVETKVLFLNSTNCDNYPSKF